MEIEKLQRIAKRYEDEGYEVIVQPHGQAIPSFANGYEPDLIASRGKAKVVVQVKRDRLELAHDRSVSRLAEITNAQPGWRFDLIILEAAETPLEEAAARAAEPSAKQIEQLLVHAQKSASADETLASFVLAWSGLEAAMRFKTRSAGLGGAQPMSPTVLVRVLYAAGLLSSAELRHLDKTSKIRDQIVHGFVPRRMKPTEVHYVAGLARRLLKSHAKPDLRED
jgi:hypothetical protein